jgi:hypothetical protein
MGKMKVYLQMKAQRAGDEAQMVDHLPGKLEALSTNSSTIHTCTKRNKSGWTIVFHFIHFYIGILLYPSLTHVLRKVLPGTGGELTLVILATQGRDWGDLGLKPAWENNLQDPISKNPSPKQGLLEGLNVEALSSNSSIGKGPGGSHL